MYSLGSIRLKIKGFIFSSTMSNTARTRLSITHQHLYPVRCNSTLSSQAETIQNINQGTKYTKDFKNYAINKGNNKILSYFHDIPLNLDLKSNTANVVIEIPRWTNAKFEINSKLAGNPITQDVKKGKVRFVKNLFPHHGYIHNYGAFPQTWEDPTVKHEELGLVGDNDPLDICEIGSNIIQTGCVKRVKILGSLALIDDGELDWKVIVVDVADPLANEVHDIHDIYVKCPGLLEATRQWFRDYKIPDGKPQNKFAFNGVYKNQPETMEVIKDCSNAWKKLVNGDVKSEGIPNIHNTTIENSPGFIAKFEDQQLLSNPAKSESPIPSEVDRSYFCPTD